jgi:hypothetical protein
MATTRERRPSIVGPVILITVGLLALLHNLDVLPANFWLTLWRLWPVVLILIGVEIFLSQLRLPWLVNLVLAMGVVVAAVVGVVFVAYQWPVEADTSRGEPLHIERDRQGATSASVRLSFGMGELRVGAVSGDKILVADFGQITGQPQPEVVYSVSGGRGALAVSSPEHQPFWVFVSPMGIRWDVRLSSDIPLDLRVEAGASTSDLVLTDLKLSDLSIRGGLSTTVIRLPRSGSYRAHISGGLATTTVYVPEGVAARIRVDGGMSSINVDQSRFAKSGNYYISPNYDSAANKVDLILEGGLATLSVR